MNKYAIDVKHYKVGWVGFVLVNGEVVACTVPHEHYIEAIDPAYWLAEQAT